MLIVVHARKDGPDADRPWLSELQKAPLGSRQPVCRRGIFLEEALERRREIRQRARVATPQRIQRLWSRLAERVPGAGGKIVLRRLKRLPRVEQGCQLARRQLAQALERRAAGKRSDADE